MKRVIIFLFAVIFSCCFVHCNKEEKDIFQSEDSIQVDSLKPNVPFEGQILFQSDADGDNEIYLLTKEGVRKLTDNTWNDEFPKWSPDGKKIAFSANPKGSYEIFVMEADGSKIVPLTQDTGNRIGFAGHCWLPDGEKIAYTVEKKKGIFRNYSSWVIDVESKKIQKLIPLFDGQSASPDFSPAEPLMGFTGKRTVGWDVAVYNFRIEKAVFLTEGGKACRPHFSKNGKKIAYVSSEADGKGDIWVMNPDGAEKTRITEREETYDYFPSWSPDGIYIVFCSSYKHYPYQGIWALHLVNVQTKKVRLLFRSTRRDVFPDWR